jgi:glutathione S-transferase
MPARRLLTIPISHYCDKARWGLERAGLVYREEPHLQMLHWGPVRRAGGGYRVPVLVTREDVFTESHDILRYADSKLPAAWRLYPPRGYDEVVSLERRLDREYGVETRRLFYGQLTTIPRELVLAVNNQTAPRWERSAVALAFSVAGRLLLRSLDVRPETLIRAADRVMRTLDAMAARLSDGRPFLCGDRLTSADVAFGALSAPLIAPPEYGVRLPPRAEFPSSIQRFLKTYDGHPAAEHARRLYATERRRSVPLESGWASARL